MLRPAEDLALYRAEMAAWPGVGDAQGLGAGPGRLGRGQRRLPPRHPREAVRRGPAHRPASCPTPRWCRGAPAGGTTTATCGCCSRCMVQRGEVAVAGRDGRDRLWDLAERVYPDVEPVPARGRAPRSARATARARSGIARAKAAPDARRAEPRRRGRRAGRGRGRPRHAGASTRPTSRTRPFEGRAALLSPLDRLVYRPQADGRAVRVRLPARDVQAGGQAALGLLGDAGPPRRPAGRQGRRHRRARARRAPGRRGPRGRAVRRGD